MLHVIGHIEGVWVSQAKDLEKIMDRIAEKCEFTVVSKAFHQFEPHGATGVLVLAESHFSAHTYPENNKVYIDVFCCNPNFDPEFCIVTIEKEFSSSEGTWKIIPR
jgi:S-adenosylmethionine decarboxylase proenzyme